MIAAMLERKINLGEVIWTPVGIQMTNKGHYASVFMNLRKLEDIIIEKGK